MRGFLPIMLVGLISGMAGAQPPRPPARAPLARRQSPSLEPLLRELVAKVALRQARTPDDAWEKPQRDCAGLIRYAYHNAFRALAPSRLEGGLWRDAHGQKTPFADAETLLSSGNFVALGRGAAAEASLRSGDLLAFVQPSATAEPVYHLMLVVRPQDAAQAPTLVVYHPGPGAPSVRSGTLRALRADAPLEWRPSEENSAFLGYFRFKEWIP